jgi:hypothetical protein
MAIYGPTDTELWRAEADKLYLPWLIGQQLSPEEHKQKREAALALRLKRSADGDQRVQNRLRATGDTTCIAHADRYPGADA